MIASDHIRAKREPSLSAEPWSAILLQSELIAL